MKRLLLWDIETKNYLQFFVFTALALLAHAVQIGIRIKGHAVFLALQNGDPSVQEDQWLAYSHAAWAAEVIFSLVPIVFFIWIGLRLIFSKVRPRTVLAGTAAAYLLLFAVFVPVSFSARLNPDNTANVLLPLLFALLRTAEILAAAFLIWGLVQLIRIKRRPSNAV